MKKVLLSLLVILLVSFSTYAQERQGRQGRGDRFSLPKELNLTDEQQTKVDVINADFKTKFEELRSKSDMSRDDRRAKIKELTEQYDKSVNEVLTSEQQTKWKEWKDKVKKENESRRGQRNRNS